MNKVCMRLTKNLKTCTKQSILKKFLNKVKVTEISQHLFLKQSENALISRCLRATSIFRVFPAALCCFVPSLLFYRKAGDVTP